MPQRDRLSGGEIVGWTLAGLGIGLVAGAVLAAMTGRGAPARVRRALTRWRGSPRPAPGITGGVRDVRAALDQSELRHFGIEIIPVRTGVIELRGWVPTRAIRARAVRLAIAVPGIERVINGLLVQGEDDKGLKPVSGLTDQTA
ncbi:MAG TPA: BON domain-containing protein [Gemmatimonadales bacterium]|nr:BON domain-containing protein [Gemmatimonadales bacterium]